MLGGGCRRNDLQDGLGCRRDLRLGSRDVGSRLEEDLDDTAAVVGLALDVLDAVHGRRESALVVVDDPPGHVLGKQARVGPHRRDDGILDRGKMSVAVL